jgi:hypothetical protein
MNEIILKFKKSKKYTIENNFVIKFNLESTEDIMEEIAKFILASDTFFVKNEKSELYLEVQNALEPYFEKRNFAAKVLIKKEFTNSTVILEII